MANAALDAFVKEALARGEKRERISGALVAAGWTKKEVDAALADWVETDFGMAAPKPKAYVSAREAFLYLVLFLLLGVVTWNLGSLLFALVDLRIPDAVEGQPNYLYGGLQAQIRSAIAGLVVAGPIFAWLAWHIRAQRRANPAMQRSRVRKWLTYITLVIAACTLIGDAIGLVYNFLSGDLSTRLLLKMLIIAMLAGAVFLYFIRDAEQGDALDQKA